MDEILQNLCTCGICHEPVNYAKKLKCQHVFCHECLIGYITQYLGQTSFPCPVCSYKHVPQEPETEVGESMLSNLEEDSLTRSLCQFYSQENERPALPTDDGVFAPLCSFHPRIRCSYYCEACNSLACIQCKRNMHHGCNLLAITKTMATVCYNRIRQISSDLDAVVSQTQLIHGKLTSKLEHAIPDRENTESTVKAYYADLKEKVVNYLCQQEEMILKKARKLEEKEKMHLERDVSVCSSLLASLDNQQKLAIALLLQTSMKPSQNMVVAGDLSKNVLSFGDVLPLLESDLTKSFDLRFMINTELEDKLTNSDIVNIEVIDSCHSGPYAVTVNDEESDDVFHDQLANVTTAPQTDSHEGDEDSLPTYGSVVQHPSLLLHRSSDSSSFPRPVPTAPPLPRQQEMDVTDVPHMQPSAPPLPEAVDNANYAVVHTESEPHVSPSVDVLVTTSTRDGIVGLTYKEYVDIQLSGDINVPFVVAIATVGETFVLIDKSNYCMKVLSQHGALLNVYDFGYVEPWDVAAISEEECVVTAPKQKQLLFLSDPGLKQGEETSVRKALTTGQYAHIAFHKESQHLIACRCPPFCATRIDLIDLQGRVRRKISLDYCTNPRNIVVTNSFDIIVSDLGMSKVIFFKSDDSTAIHKKDFIGHAAVSLAKPQGIAIVNELDLVMLLDKRNGDVSVTSFSGQMKKVLRNQISVDGSVEEDYQMCTNIDGTTLAVTKTDGFVSLYEIEYSYLPFATQI
ncbi:tripartite motif-containing protein 55-like [Mizuhopecten yessoensis]|uniref:Tripartite motif-containing protein 3 n=1 Tax=Mizuhopecten yessoensis TaxID=6573 RepID=A0A210Q9K6_MIZYE|nr:tripartite motif-containing protein 55-like [Mizuhopecten yessoensis]XP_021363895.1 tripartite motif-containing protein 55-like [Mizuhopecten yessoensis]OWF45395.1 Tripartite motif-containing protein 3 [Mizuhopecten yessoensis]